MKLVRGVLFLCAMCAGALSVFAQQSVDLASVSGRVTDPSGAVVPGAQITVRHTQTNLTTHRTQRPAGPISPSVPAGRLVPNRGSSTRLPGRDSSSDTDRRRRIRVASHAQPGSRRHECYGDRRRDGARGGPQSDRSHGVPEPEVRSLPLNGRNFLEMALLVPGVSPTNIASTQLFPETSAVPGVSLSVGSQRNLSNNFIVDGLSANDDAAALSGITYAVDAVEQFQVVTSGGQAELGRALGGYVNVVTKSGTNVLHGTVYDYCATIASTRRMRCRGRRCRWTRRSMAAASAARSSPNRTFYFANVEQRRLDQTGPGHDLRRKRRRRQRATRRRRLSGPADRNGPLSEPGGLDEPARQGRSPSERPRPIEHPLQPVRRRGRELTRRRRPQRAERIVRARQSTIRPSP